MCITCGKLNYEKREYKANLFGNIALVTGIRVKIGFAIALKLLQCGCKVYGTTRYPKLTLINYEKESDYEIWKNNLIIIKYNAPAVRNKLIYQQLLAHV